MKVYKVPNMCKIILGTKDESGMNFALEKLSKQSLPVLEGLLRAEYLMHTV